MDLSGKFSGKIRAAIKAKLTELGAYVDDELPDYIMVMVANRKGKDHMAKDLALFLGHNTSLFIDWLHSALSRLESGGDAASAATPAAPTQITGAVDSGAKDLASKPPVSISVPVPALPGAPALASPKPQPPVSAPATAAPAPASLPKPPPSQPQQQQQQPAPHSTPLTAPTASAEESGRRHRPKSPTPPPAPERRGDRDRRRSSGASGSGPGSALRRQSSGGRRADERESRAGGRRGGCHRRSRSRSRSRTRSRSPRLRSGSRSRERRAVASAAADGSAVVSRTRPAAAPLKAKNMLMKAMSEAERSVKASKRGDLSSIPSQAAVAPDPEPDAAAGSATGTGPVTISGDNGGLSERIRDRLGEQRAQRSRSRTRSRSADPRDDRRRRHRRQRRRHRGSRSRSAGDGRRRRSHSGHRRASRGGKSTERERRAKSPSTAEETKKVIIVSDSSTQPVPSAPAAASATVAAAPVVVPVATPAALPAPVPALSSVVSSPAPAVAPTTAAAAAAAVQPQFVVTLTGAGDRYRQLADRLGSRRLRPGSADEDDAASEDEFVGVAGATLEQLAEEIIEFEEFEEELPLTKEYKLTIGDSDTEEERSPLKRPTAVANRIAPAGQQPQAKQRCRYWPGCKSGQACPYWHPVEPCKAFPNCKFGSACLFVHPPCRFQAMCANPACPYTHATGGAAAAVQLPPALTPTLTSALGHRAGGAQPVKCRFFPNCTNVSCPFYHPTTMCRYGLACANQQTCMFNHPSLPNRSKLVWTKGAQPPGAEPENTPMPPAAAATGDGTMRGKAGHNNASPAAAAPATAAASSSSGGVIKLR